MIKEVKCKHAYFSMGVSIGLFVGIVFGIVMKQEANETGASSITTPLIYESPALLEQPCVINRVVDGDTFDADVDIGYNLTLKMRIRALYINAPEMKTPEGPIAKEFAQNALIGKEVFFIPSGKKDSFGRWLGDLKGDFGIFSQYMLENNHAVPFKK